MGLAVGGAWPVERLKAVSGEAKTVVREIAAF
jgi:hypothetical protein